MSQTPQRFKLSDLAIANPASTYIFGLILVIAGLFAYMAMPRESAPDIQIPLLIVTIPYPGSSPEDVEALIIHKVEPELQGIQNLKKMSSTSTEGAGIVTLEFFLGTNITEARNKVREALDLAKPELPSDAKDPIIGEINLSETPIMIVNLSGHYDLFQLKNIAEDLKEEIEAIPGVLEVKRAGGLEREVKVEVDEDKLNYYNLDLNQVSNAISQENATIPAGDLVLGSMKYMIRVPGEISGPDEIRDMVVAAPNQVPIFVKDLAQVNFGFEEVNTRSRLYGLDSVSLSVSKRSGENLIAIADKVYQLAQATEKKYDGNLKVSILNDQSKRIKSMVSDLENNIYTGMIFVVGILMLVMGLSSALFIGSAIPLSMLISFIIMDQFHITLNFVVLFSLILALGMLVDNGIVVVENIYRHLETGLSPREAASVGVGEVAIPVISSTVTTVAAFLPLLFMPGIAGEFMGYLPKTLIITLGASLFVGLVLSPIMCSTLLKPHKVPVIKDEVALAEKSRFLRLYRFSLLWALERRWKVIAMVMAAWFGLMLLYFVWVFPKKGVEFFPETEPTSITLEIEAPFGTTLETSDQIVQKVEKSLEKYHDHTDAIVANIGQRQGSGGGAGAKETHNSHITLSFPGWEERTLAPHVIVEEVRKGLDQFSGAFFRVTKPSSGPPTGKPVNLELSGADPVTLKELSVQIQGTIKDLPGLVNLQDNMSATRSEVQVRLDREKIALLGLSTRAVANLLRTAFNGREVSTWRVGKDEYNIVVRLDPRFRANIGDVSGLFIKTPDGRSVALSELAEIKTTAAKGSIRHINSKTVITISGDAEGFPGPVVLKKVQEKLKDFPLPTGYKMEYTGENESRNEMQDYLGKSFLIAIFLIFLVLVTQFNSLLLPFIILTSVFMSLIGVFLGWIIHQSPISIMMGGIGIISLAGVVVNNAIVLIDYINQLKVQGKSTRDALVLAGMLRMRPVMMTAITTILGLVPIVMGMDINFYRSNIVAFGSESSEMWRPMALSVVYGLGIATLLTLIVVPVIYSLMDSLAHKSGKVAARVGERLQGPLERLNAKTPKFDLLEWMGLQMDKLASLWQKRQASKKPKAPKKPKPPKAPADPKAPEIKAPGAEKEPPKKIKLPDWLKDK